MLVEVILNAAMHTGNSECLETNFDSDDYYEQSSQLREQRCRNILNSIDRERSMHMVNSLLHATFLLNEDNTSSLLTKVYHKCLEWEKEKLVLNSIQTVIRDYFQLSATISTSSEVAMDC